MYILIDDDLLIRKSWEFAAKKVNVDLLTFSDVESFIEKTKELKLDSKIYIDQDLGAGKKGVEESFKILDLGFKNIYLATGHNPETIKIPPHIIEITGKTPPF